MNVSSLYVAEIKDQLGLSKQYRYSGKRKNRQPQCPEDEDAASDGNTVRFYHNGRIAIGMAGGRYLGGGEAGPEAVVGTDKLAAIIRTAVASVSGGTTVIPVYIGQERIDENVVRAAQSQNFRSAEYIIHLLC